MNRRRANFGTTRRSFRRTALERVLRRKEQQAATLSMLEGKKAGAK